MADFEDVRRIALSLPNTSGEDGFAVQNKGKTKGFAWVWQERVHPKKARVPNPNFIAIRTADLEDKEMLLASDTDKFFTEPHYNNFPAILVRLANIEVEELEELITEGWRCRAPKELVDKFESARNQLPL